MEYINNLISNTKCLLEHRNISIRQLAAIIGIPPSSLADALKSKKGPSLDVAIKIADSLGYTVEELSHTNSSDFMIDSTPLLKDEQILVDKIRLLSSEGRDKVVEYVDDLISSGKYKKCNFDGNVGKKEA